MRFIGVARRFSVSSLLRISADEARSVLSVDVGAQQKEIHAQYLKKVRLFHPDSPNKVDPETGELMSDEEKRIKFDNLGNAYDLLVKGDESEETKSDGPADGHAMTEAGFPKVASIAYAKHILGVEPSATEEEIKEAYLKVSLRHHPDLVDDEDDLADYDQFKLVTQAYKTFMNQKVLTEGRIHYEDILPDDSWTIQGRQGINRTRKHEDPQTMLGQDGSTWTLKNIKQRFKRMPIEMREEDRNVRHTTDTRTKRYADSMHKES